VEAFNNEGSKVNLLIHDLQKMDNLRITVKYWKPYLGSRTALTQTVISFVLVSVIFGICTALGINGTLVEAKYAHSSVPMHGVF
jgi:hypothetical protein